MDFGIFGFSPEQVQEFRTFVANQQAQARARAEGTTQTSTGSNTEHQQQQEGNTERQQENGNNGNSGAGNQDEPVLMHNAHHVGVVCDVCNSEIRGFRYKCMQCPDFDLCSKCEHKGHHAGHVMMRISFPEQARDAIRKYLSNAGSPSPPPRFGPFAHFGAEGSPYHRRSHPHCMRRGHGGHHGGQGGDSDNERPATAPGCPYEMGKKEFKKWAKWMKRASAHQHRSAEAYARAAASAGGTSAAAGAEAGPESPMDFAAVASQIQEFLNYWGIPVDVIELYDQFGNRGQPTSGQGAAEQNPPSTQTEPNQTPATDATTTETQPASPSGAANLSENLQQMRIDENNVSAARDELLMDLDGENSGWTIVNDSRESTPGNSARPSNAGQQQSGSAGTPQGSIGNENSNAEPAATGAGSMNSNNGSMPTPSGFVSAESNASSGATPASPSAPSFPAGVPNVPLYPVLNQPQIQQILQGVSSAVNSVVRSIPIVTDPRGPVGTNVTNSSPGQVSTATGVPSSDAPVEMDGRCMKTLNQLLAMGFSNEGGYLTRLVVAKNGDLEAVLGSLFPN